MRLLAKPLREGRDPLGRETLGDFEKLVLLALLQLGNESYGAEILAEIERRTGRSASSGAMYVALRRLEEKGALSSRFGDPTPTRGGRAKRYFRIEGAGLKQLREAHRELTSMAEGLESVLETS
jgi:PadR family transcriptional regulator PadR